MRSSHYDCFQVDILDVIIFQTYAFRVNQYQRSSGYDPETPTASPTPTSGLPKFKSSNFFGFQSFSGPSYVSDTLYGIDVVRYGIVTDLNNGQYELLLCPVIAGLYEVHILLGASGVANQHFSIQNTASSLMASQTSSISSGTYIADSPYAMIVTHTRASAYTSTATGEGLQYALAGMPASFTVTVRDPWDNILRDNTYLPVVSAKMDRLPTTSFSVTNIGNGTYSLVYTPTLSGGNYLSVYVNGFQIRESPFVLNVFSSFSSFMNATNPTPVGSVSRRALSTSTRIPPGRASPNFSYVIGDGLFVGTTGFTSYFQLYAFDSFRNRIITNTDTFVFNITGDPAFQNKSIPLITCPLPPLLDHPICDPFDLQGGHYFGHFVPTVSGFITIQVFLKESTNYDPLHKSKFEPFISPSAPIAEYSDVSGNILEFDQAC